MKSRFSKILSLSLSSVDAWAQHYLSEQEIAELEAQRMIRESDLGVERVEFFTEDGVWSYFYQLSSDIETPETYTEGPNTWRYIGQAIFPVEPKAPVLSGWTQVPDYILTGIEYDPDEYLGVGTTTKIDRYGRKWLLEYVDLELLEQKIREYDAVAATEYGLEPGISNERTGIEYPEDAGDWYYTEAFSWTTADCAGDWRADIAEHSSDDLDDATHPLGPIMKKTVLVERILPTGLTDQCSGVMVGDTVVLTAAHCLANEDGHYDPANMVICTQENLQLGAECFEVDSITPKPSTWDEEESAITDDYGVMELVSSPNIGTFLLSQADDTTIEGNIQYHRGYPGYFPNCDDNYFTDNNVTVIDTFLGMSPFGSHLMYAEGDVQSTPTGLIRFDISSAVGMSGGPFYMCPTNDCSQLATLTSVLHGWNGVLFCNEGVKIPDIRGWVIDFL